MKKPITKRPYLLCMTIKKRSTLLNFNQVLSQTVTPHLLLGNGFSIAYDQKRFSFTTLLASAVRDGIIDVESKIYKVFQKLDTSDFESVMKAMGYSVDILAVYSNDTKILKKISDDRDSIKEYLVKIITNNHPEKSTSLLVKEKNACVDFLKNFKKIYTLNYDLLLYWSTMQDQAPQFADGFGNTEDSILEGYVVYKNSSSYPMNIHYLHGAMHYFDNGDEVIKKTYNNTDKNLIEQVRESLEKNIYPIFISEGNSEQKKTKIMHSAYLNHCFKSLRSINGDIVIFGASLKDNDKHIVAAILESKVKRIYYGTSDTNSAKHVATAIDSYNHTADKNHKKQLFLYDYKTVNIWGR